jgi:alkyl hydroperoxide reductase subunit D
MSIENLKDRLPDFAKDVRLNLSTLANDETLEKETKYGLLLACAIAARNSDVRVAFEHEALIHLSVKSRDAARAAATIMSMNNVYYRFTHLAQNQTYRELPAKLRMNILGSHGVSKKDFELWSLAVSAINGCGMCIDTHEKVLLEAGVTAETIQTAVRFAAVIVSAAVALEASEQAAMV